MPNCANFSIRDGKVLEGRAVYPVDGTQRHIDESCYLFPVAVVDVPVIVR